MNDQARPIISYLLVGSLVVVSAQELFRGADSTQIHLPPVGASLTANSSFSITTASIVATYDSIKEAEYIQPANEKPVTKNGAETEQV